MSTSAHQAFPVWPENHSVVLPNNQASTLTKQCSRPSLKHITGSWQPKQSEIRIMEQQLDRFLQTHYPTLRQQVTQQYFQYAGLIRKGHRIIYINAVDDYVQNNPEWGRIAMIICDGGKKFWGLEYDPAQRKFSNMQFNSGI
ncbi:hypothetical protein [Undibacterium fentianense]|uniref:Uncharacterized protein n=1 Tax=Undibacterium fentianense TaxID=2828728 RepID=A0A941E2Q9_9BURK|nr:hypothetical protein [Undibacterium fentianense]MBR7800361.1 hypothetical protein [Undibacterium fentianense]